MKPKRPSRRERWESLCNRCGLCCYEKDYDKGRGIIVLSLPCRYLDEETNLCTVYDRRFKTCRECRKVTIFHALFSPFMPESCGYVRHYRRWRIALPALVRGVRRTSSRQGAETGA